MHPGSWPDSAESGQEPAVTGPRHDTDRYCCKTFGTGARCDFGRPCMIRQLADFRVSHTGITPKSNQDGQICSDTLKHETGWVLD